MSLMLRKTSTKKRPSPNSQSGLGALNHYFLKVNNLLLVLQTSKRISILFDWLI